MGRTKGTVEVKNDGLSKLHNEEYAKIKNIEQTMRSCTDREKYFERKTLENGVIKNRVIGIKKGNKMLFDHGVK